MWLNTTYETDRQSVKKSNHSRFKDVIQEAFHCVSGLKGVTLGGLENDAILWAVIYNWYLTWKSQRSPPKQHESAFSLRKSLLQDKSKRESLLGFFIVLVLQMKSCEKQTQLSGFCPKESHAFMKQEVKHNTTLKTPRRSHVYWNISSLTNMMHMALLYHTPSQLLSLPLWIPTEIFFQHSTGK